MKRAAIIGHSSMVGKRLSALLASRGVAVIKCGRGPDSDIYIDLAGNCNSFDNGIGTADVLFQCAAGFYDDTWEGCRKNELVNASGAYRTLQLAESLQCRQVINAGTVSSIAGVESARMSSYGFSKARGEDIIEWGLSGKNTIFTSVRFPQIYDEFGECCRHQPWFGRIVAYAAAGKDLRLPKSMGPRNFLHVVDAAGLLLAAWERKATGRLSIAHGESLDYSSIAARAYSVFDRGGTVHSADEKSPFRKVDFPDGAAAFEMLGYWPSIRMSEGLAMIKNLNTQSNFGPMDVL